MGVITQLVHVTGATPAGCTESSNQQCRLHKVQLMKKGIAVTRASSRTAELEDCLIWPPLFYILLSFRINRSEGGLKFRRTCEEISVLHYSEHQFG